MIYATPKEAVETLCSHVCRKRPNLRLNPRHCDLRREKASGRMTGTNPAVTGCSPFWECRGCEGPVPNGATVDANAVDSVAVVSATAPEPVRMKRCRGACKQEKPANLEHFYAHAKTADRLSGECKECFRTRQREYEQQKKRRKKPK